MLGKRVLVIEDDKDSLHAISELLCRAEYEVLTAESGREGLRLLHAATPPDVVLLDCWLPDMTGQAWLSMCARWPGAANVPVLLLTDDDAWVEDHSELNALGVSGVLSKPMVPEELLSQLEQTLLSAQPAAAAHACPQNNEDTNAARQTRRWSDLLARASEVLAQGLDIGAQLRDLARAIVPAFASACVIERVDTAAAVREVLCTQHESSALDADLRSWARRPEWLAEVLSDVAESGKPRLLELEKQTTLLSSDVASARALGFESVAVAPLIARGRLFGVLTCAARAARRYELTHLQAFAGLGHRIALALDNAELYARAQQTRRDYDALCHALSSELQTPLAALGNLASKGVERSETKHERDLAETFLRDTRQIEAKLLALRDFASCAAGQLRLNLQEVELAQHLRARVEKHPQPNRLTLRVEPDLWDARVLVDIDRLEQALDAVLHVAAAHAAPSSSVEVALSRPCDEETELHLVVSCTGPCLSEQELGDVGQLASRDYDSIAAASCSAPAFGLRLARALIEAQGGRFWVQTRRNVGNAFYIALPLPSVHVRDTTYEPSPNAVILIVDSDLAFRRELQEILSERGYHVETADNGLQAWQYLLAHSAPALILFDLVLPAMDGWELHAAIKSHAALQLVPTVVVSGLDRYRVEASLPDAHGYIEKPIRSAQLFEVVHRYVATPARPRTLSVRPSSFC